MRFGGLQFPIYGIGMVLFGIGGLVLYQFDPNPAGLVMSLVFLFVSIFTIEVVPAEVLYIEWKREQERVAAEQNISTQKGD